MIKKETQWLSNKKKGYINNSELFAPRDRIPPHLKWNSFLSDVWTQVYEDQRDVIIAVCGGTGMGKSTLALWLAEQLDIDRNGKSRFKPERIVFGFDEWIKQLEKNNPFGTVIIMEEPQSYMNSRTFYSKSNIEAVTKFSTLRVFRYIYILTYPSFERIDNQLRERIHYYINMDSPDRKNKLSRWVPHRLVESYTPGYPMYRMPYYFSRKGRNFMLRCTSKLPSDNLWSDYKLKEMNWKSAMKDGRIDNLGNIKGSEEEEQQREEVDFNEHNHEIIKRNQKARVAKAKAYLDFYRDKILSTCKKNGSFVRTRIKNVTGCSKSIAVIIIDELEKEQELELYDNDKSERNLVANERA